MNVRSAFVYVKNLGQKTEEAYWENSEPVLAATSTNLMSEIQNHIRAAVERGEIYGGVIERVDESTKTGVVTLWIEDKSTGKCVEKRFCVRKISGKLEFEEIAATPTGNSDLPRVLT